MSVLCTDEFMLAIKMDRSWQLVFPNYEQYPSEYKANWNGDLATWMSIIDSEDSVVVYYKFESARDLWNLIMENTYNRNEPGVSVCRSHESNEQSTLLRMD